MRTLILNFAKGGWYPAGQRRLVQSLGDVLYDGETMCINDEREIAGCPSHQEVPYAFKPAMFEEARKAGYRLVLWCDAAVWAIRGLEPVFQHIEEHGHLFFLNHDQPAGKWTSDAALAELGVHRDMAMRIPSLMGCCMGLDLRRNESLEFLKVWLEKSRDGKTFPGAWTNDQQQVSSDPRCMGHRHDQSVASILAWVMEMELNDGTYFQYYENPNGTPFVYGSTNDMSLICPSVVLCNQGMG